ncbi:MAG: TIM barrel protein [Chloroflexi bacterium]|nr:TIM barrel protein [Chloroflexota bacterium]
MTAQARRDLGEAHLGCCRPPEDALLAARQGWNFVELPFGHLGVLEDPAGCAAVAAQLGAAGLRAESFHRFLPAHLRLVGEDLDLATVQLYLEKALARVAALGGQVVVFSGGRGRTVPDGFPRERGREQFVALLRRAGKIAADHGITLVLEPLNRRETNLITTVAEGAEVVLAAAHPAVRLMADLYHMVMEDEPFAALESAPDLLAHVHVADTGRLAPGTGEYDYAGFFGTLRRIGYAGRIAAENTWRDFAAEGGPAVTFLRRRWAAAVPTSLG